MDKQQALDPGQVELQMSRGLDLIGDKLQQTVHVGVRKRLRYDCDYNTSMYDKFVD